jgi:hypothetical protein
MAAVATTVYTLEPVFGLFINAMACVELEL